MKTNGDDSRHKSNDREYAAPDGRHGPLEHKIELFLPLSDAELRFLNSLRQDRQDQPGGTDLIIQGDAYDQVLILLEGWAMRHRTLSDGRRQITNFVLPGDFIGLQAMLFERSDHFVTTLTQVKVARLPPERLLELFERFPRLAAAVSWTAAREESVIAERVASLGRRTAYGRMAHLCLELMYRLETIGIAHNGGYVMPVTQEILADVLGLSVVHVNRTLRRLNQNGLVQRQGRKIVLPDIATLRKAADFEGTFLHIGPPPRRIRRDLEQMDSSGSGH